MKKITTIILVTTLVFLVSVSTVLSFWGKKSKTLIPKNDAVKISTADITDGKARYFKVKANDGIMVSFFVLKSSDNVIRAAIDACDVCYRSGKGYVQEGDFMVCTNCGRKFASERINEVKGGCNPAPLKRKISGKDLVVEMKDINANSWYCKYKKQ
ncbi:MAG: DUF2318 domain-containing protein [Desulfobacterales bacterium]|nr:DUF2318 domain-containing protein [Desulfobacterales bacterium]